MRLLPILLIVVTASAIAQGPPTGGMGGPPPEVRKAFEAMRKWRETHKNVIALEQTVRVLPDIQADPKTKLNKRQAQSVLAIIAQWKGKPTLTDAQAKQVNQQLTKTLTVAQLKKIAAVGQRRSPGGPGGRPPMGGPGGPPPIGGGPSRPGGPPRFEPPKPKDYNPLNPSTLPFVQMRPAAQRRMDQLIKSLKTTK